MTGLVLFGIRDPRQSCITSDKTSPETTDQEVLDV